jgi:hypothetical protein
MTVGAFVVLAASSPTPKRRVCLRLEGCLIPLGSPLSFWNELAVRGVVDPGRHAPAAYPFERLIRGLFYPMSSPLFFWEQLAGLPRL